MIDFVRTHAGPYERHDVREGSGDDAVDLALPDRECPGHVRGVAVAPVSIESYAPVHDERVAVAQLVRFRPTSDGRVAVPDDTVVAEAA